MEIKLFFFAHFTVYLPDLSFLFFYFCSHIRVFESLKCHYIYCRCFGANPDLLSSERSFFIVVQLLVPLVPVFPAWRWGLFWPNLSVLSLIPQNTPTHARSSHVSIPCVSNFCFFQHDTIQLLMKCFFNWPIYTNWTTSLGVVGWLHTCGLRHVCVCLWLVAEWLRAETWDRAWGVTLPVSISQGVSGESSSTGGGSCLPSRLSQGNMSPHKASRDSQDTHW